MTSKATKEHVEKGWKFCQSCLRANSVLIIGSGASVAYNLPNMESLGKNLIDNIEKEKPDLLKNALWQSFKEKLKEMGLEQAIDITDIWKNDEIYAAIKSHTWRYIVSKDAIVQELVRDNSATLALSKLLRHLLTSDNNLIRVVTPNYDRLIEYASEAADILWRTNFQPGYMGAWRGDKPSLEFWNCGKKVPEKHWRFGKYMVH
ncbi:hypothetical protein [Nitrosomonas sp. Nm166]|uniref:hypothetical protein n=1 Tax=Nitrosomonas sp. Nm166 TaxID=1881054 RepID=UPI0008E45989|nr:hypothetical protein [Nitrosomonas sp. Nm166]SFF03793.1 hypothetical protein SAMN05428977_104419 [Nitrosomonas sp. Nm166]